MRESQGSPGQYVLTGMQGGLKKHLLLVDPEGVVSIITSSYISYMKLIHHVVLSSSLKSKMTEQTYQFSQNLVHSIKCRPYEGLHPFSLFLPVLQKPHLRLTDVVLCSQYDQMMTNEIVTFMGAHLCCGECSCLSHLCPQVRTKDRMFESVSHLINYHCENELPIISAESALVLRRPVHRNRQP